MGRPDDRTIAGWILLSECLTDRFVDKEYPSWNLKHVSYSSGIPKDRQLRNEYLLYTLMSTQGFKLQRIYLFTHTLNDFTSASYIALNTFKLLYYLPKRNTISKFR